MRTTVVCKAQYILDFFGVQQISCIVLAGIMDVSSSKAASIMRELGWEKEIVLSRSRRGVSIHITVYHRVAPQKIMFGRWEKRARRECAMLLSTTPEHLALEG